METKNKNEWSDWTKCPTCGALLRNTQPQPSLHCVTTEYKCGFIITTCIGSNNVYIDEKCGKSQIIQLEKKKYTFTKWKKIN